MRPHTHIMLIIALAVSTTFAGTSGKISGKLTDSETGEPLTGCNIMLVGTTQGGISDNEGRYFILNIPPGIYAVEYRMMGYTTVRKENIIINIDRTTIQNIAMEPTILEGEPVIVYGAEEEVRLDVAFAQVAISSEQIVSAPTGLDFRETIAMSVGVTRNDHGMLMIRGSDVDGVGVYVDNFNSNDVRLGNPDFSFSKEAIQEVQIIRGGFSAEYGQAMSGMINIVKKEGASDRYTGSFDFRLSPPGRKHFGPDIYSADNWWDVGRFLSMEPTEDRDGDGNPDFEGWTSWYNSHENIAKGSSDSLTYEIWKYQHRPRTYADKPDYYMEATLGGPVPFTKGKVTFFLDGYSDNSQFPFPVERPAFYNYAANLKLRFALGPMTKLYLRGGYSGVHSVTYDGSYERRDSGRNAGGNYFALTDAYINPHYWENVGFAFKQLNRWRHIYDTDGRLAKTNIWRYDLGLELEQTLNRSSFYSLRFQYNQKRYLTGHGTWRNPDTLGWIGDWPMTEEPEGYVPDNTKDQLLYHAVGSGNGERDSTRYETYFINADYTNQLTSVHQLKVGAGLNIHNMHLKYGTDRLKVNATVRYESWQERTLNFLEGYAYVQDKVEFEGMIMDIGLRADILNHTEPQFLEAYSKYYNKTINFDSLYQAPHEVKDGLKIILAPRLGVSHPIGVSSKVFFNYGYFYQRPRIEHFFLHEQSLTDKMRTMGNPELDYRKVISYEVGVEQSVAGMLSFTLTGYYKDLSNETGTVRYIGSNNEYERKENNRYSDIRGFELETRFHKSVFRAMVSYDYRIESGGQYGWNVIYQDPFFDNKLKSARQGLSKARPEVSAYAGIITPEAQSRSLRDVLFSGLSMTFYFRWRAGQWMTYHSDYYPGDEVNNIQWKPSHNVDLRVEKEITAGRFGVAAYAEVRNLLNSKFLTSNPVFFFDKNSRYQNAYLDLIGELGLEPGDYDHPEMEKLLMSLGYYTLYGFPRDIWIGLKFRF
ncbi:carboxypeptidase regulatory-like domain-containing protein [Candidatus Neomarinimicrobiota bacterium]